MNIRFEKNYDVIVVGGGVAGVAAAVSAVRSGAKTALIEQSGILGGQATLGIVTPIGATHTNIDRRPLGGICDEYMTTVREYTKKYGMQKDTDLPDYTYTVAPHITKYVLLKMCTDTGVDVMFHTTLADVISEGNEIKGVTVLTKSGFGNLYAKAFTDATGDADLIYLSGDSYIIGSEPYVYDSLFEEDLASAHEEESGSMQIDNKSGVMQPVSVMFRMRDVDVEEAMKFNNKSLSYTDLGIDKEEFMQLPYFGKCGFEENGDRVPMPQGRILITYGSTKDTAVINMSRVVDIDGSDFESLNKGECLAQLQVMDIADFLIRYVPGFEKAYLEESANTLGVRETRRLKGKYVLTGSDVIKCRTFESAIARGSYIIDIHDPTGKKKAIGGAIKGRFYEIPFECLESAKYSNLLACGRCISADHVAHSSTRIQGTCLLTGQAAGIACSMIAKNKKADVNELREALRQSGVYLD